MYVYKFCSSILNFEGADGSTTITDSARTTGSAWAFFGNARIRTADFKIGSSSLYVDGTGDYVRMSTTPTPSDGWWDTTRAHKTGYFESWIRLKVAPAADGMFFGVWQTTSNRRMIWIGITSARQITIKYSTNGTTVNTLSTGSTFPLDTWAHLRVRILGPQTARYISVWLDNVLVYTSAVVVVNEPSASVKQLSIGGTYEGADLMGECYFDQFILTEAAVAGEAPPTVVVDDATYPVVSTLKYRPPIKYSFLTPTPYAGEYDFIGYVGEGFSEYEPLIVSGSSIPPSGTISGTVTELGVPVARIVRSYRRDTGDLVDETTSDGGTGAYTLAVFPGVEHNLVCLDNAGGTVENDLIKRKTAP